MYLEHLCQSGLYLRDMKMVRGMRGSETYSKGTQTGVSTIPLGDAGGCSSSSRSSGCTDGGTICGCWRRRRGNRGCHGGSSNSEIKTKKEE